MSTTEQIIPPDITRADQMLANHPKIERGPESANYLWKIKFGKVTYTRFRTPQEVKRKAATWCRVMRERGLQHMDVTTYPPPRIFFNSLLHKLRNE